MAVVLRHTLTNYHTPAKPAALGVAGRIGAHLRRLAHLWAERQADLRAIDTLDERDLHDIGASRWALRRELSRPFWRG